MPFKRGKIFRVDLRPAGYGRRIALSCGTSKKTRAQRMEDTIRDLAEDGKHDLLDALCRGEFTLKRLYAAKRANRLDELLRPKPLLKDAVASALAGGPSRHRYAAEKLLIVAPQNATVEWLNSADNLAKVLDWYRRYGLAADTERREWPFIRKLVRKHFGEDGRLKLMEDLKLRRPAGFKERYLSKKGDRSGSRGCG